MALTLLVVGLVITGIGVVVFLWKPPKPNSNEPATHGLTGDTAKIVEEFNKLVDRLDKRYRPGMILLAVGLAITAMGVYLKAPWTCG